MLLFVPCSAKKPYSYSKTHKILGRALERVGKRDLVHEVVVTSPLGLVPKELELFYPAKEYDIPVTGYWDPIEVGFVSGMISAYLKKNEYDHIVVHMGEEHGFLHDILPDAHFTSSSDLLSPDSIKKLSGKLNELTEGYEYVGFNRMRLEKMVGRALFQFGSAGRRLMEDSRVTGRYQTLKILSGDEQVGLRTPDRGLISLTMEGARRLAESSTYTAQIGEFKISGDIFAVGVESADHGIRVGDEVAFLNGDDIRGVGVAMMGGREMEESDRGIAIKVRHKDNAGY